MNLLIVNTIKRFVKDKKAVALVLSYVSCILGYKIINSLPAQGTNITTPLDDKIPFIQYFVIPYYSWYILVAFSFFYIYMKDNEVFYKFATCMTLTMSSALIIFLFFQTTVTRPTIIGDDFFSNLVRNIYSVDNPVNCCPSLHVSISLVCTIWVRRVSDSNVIKSSVFVVGLLIVLSTLFIKQHVILDVAVAFVQVLLVRRVVDGERLIDFSNLLLK